MRADDDVDVPLAQFVDDIALLGRRAETGEHLDRDREGGQPVAEGGVMLLGQDGGRHKHGHLLAVHDRLEGRAQGDFGLAVAHIAANEAVHRIGPLHVVLDFTDDAKLVLRLVIREGGLKLGLPIGIVGKGMAGDGFAGGIQVE